jgi:hypothetical protein
MMLLLPEVALPQSKNPNVGPSWCVLPNSTANPLVNKTLHGFNDVLIQV